MRPSLFLLTAPLVPAVLAGGEVVVPKKLSDLIEGKIEFCQNYLGWVTTSTAYTTKYYTKTKTATSYVKTHTWTVVKKGVKTKTAPTSYTTEVETKKAKPVFTKTTKTIGTKTFYDKDYTTTTTTVYTKKKPHWPPKKNDHHKRGWDHRKGPDVKHYKKYHIEWACKKLLKKVYPKTKTYWTTKTAHDKVYTTCTDTVTYTKTFTKYVPKYTKYITPVATVSTTTTLPAKTFTHTKKDIAKTTKTYTKVKTSTKTKTIPWHKPGKKDKKD